MALALRDQEHHSYREYLTWPDDARFELIDGLAYAMTPAPSVSHQEVVLSLGRQVADALDDSECRVLVAPLDVRLPRGDEEDEDIDTVVQPDVLVVCDPGKVDERGARGAPDWIIEVLSPGTAAHDQVRKLRLYEGRGVREYWLVHPVDRVVMIYRREGGAFGRPEVAELTGESKAGVVPVTIDWERVTRRLPAV